MHAGVSGSVSQASVVLQRPGYGFSQAFCWCSFAGTLPPLMRFSLPARVLCVLGLVFSAVAAMPADSELGEGGEDMSAWVVVLLVLVVLFCDSDRVGRGERSRASDACEKRMRLLAWTERISHAEAMLSAAVNSSSLSLRLYIRYGSSISISIDLSLIHGIYIGSNSSSSGRRKPIILQYQLKIRTGMPEN